MSGKETPPPSQYADAHIVVRVLGFDPTTRICRLAIDESHENVGYYFIDVRFSSGNEARIIYDGRNSERDTRPTVSTSHQNDSLESITPIRVRD